jgi:membrane protein DedA with SNARE-associated domain
VFDKAAFSIYFTVFSLLVGAGLGLPMPEELPIVGAGVVVGHAASKPSLEEVLPNYVGTVAISPLAGFPGNLPWASLAQSCQVGEPLVLHWWVMLPVCILGVVISDGLLYGMGRFWGPRLLETRGIKRLLPQQKRERIEENFHKYGVWVLLFARFLPTIRSPIFITAGVMRVPFPRFVLADGLYAIPGVSLLFWLAFWFGDQFRDLIVRAEGRVERLRPLFVLLAIAGIAGFLLHHFLRHPVATGDPEELPVIGEQVASKIEHTEHSEQARPDSHDRKSSTDGATKEGAPAQATRRDRRQ